MFFYFEADEIQQILEQWREKQILSGSYAVNEYDEFGASISMNDAGDKAVIVGDDFIYIFVSGANGWTEEATLSSPLADTDIATRPSMNAVGDKVVFGVAGGNNGEVVLFTSSSSGWQHDGTQLSVVTESRFPATSVISSDENIILSSEEGKTAGKIYIFKNGVSGWELEDTLIGGTVGENYSYTSSYDDLYVTELGSNALCINTSGNRIFAGAPRTFASSSGYDIFDSNSPGCMVGVVVIFTSGSSGWQAEDWITGSGNGQELGYAVSCNSAGNKFLAGAMGASQVIATVINPSDVAGAKLYSSSSNGWALEHTFEVDLGSDEVVYSSVLNKDGDTVVITKETLTDFVVDIYASSSSGWTLDASLTGSNDNINKEYWGDSIAISKNGKVVMVPDSWADKSGGNEDTGLTWVFAKE